MLNQLSCEATHWERGQFVEFIPSHAVKWCEIFMKFILYCSCKWNLRVHDHRTDIPEVMGSNPVEALIFFRLLPSNCLNWNICCDEHSSRSSITAVQNVNFIFISHEICWFGVEVPLWSPAGFVRGAPWFKILHFSQTCTVLPPVSWES